MKYLSIFILALFLAGCAGAPRPQIHLLAPKAPIVKAAPAPTVTAPTVVTTTPLGKPTWYDHVRKAKRWFVK